MGACVRLSPWLWDFAWAFPARLRPVRSEQRTVRRRPAGAEGPDRHIDHRRQRSERQDGRARGRAAIRQRQSPHHRDRQRPDLLQALHAGGRPGHLRADDQAHARGRQRALHRSRRQGGARRDHRSDGRFPRRLRRFAAARGRRQDALRRAARANAPRAGATPRSRAASTPPASPARTIRASRRAGRCARRASSTTTPRR